jgi:hypothetical protein
MTLPDAARAFLLTEVEGLQAFDFVAVTPAMQPTQVVEVTRLEPGDLEVRVPGRPRVVPELPIEVRAKLRERGFHSEDPADRTKPWAKGVGDAASAVALVQELLVGVFQAKADVPLDILHGNHRIEHEARQRLGVARERIEELVQEVLGRAPEQDEDKDYVLPVDDVHVMVSPRALPDGQVIIRVFAITNVGVNVAPELGLFLARLNFGLMFGRFALDTEHRSIWFDETLLGEHFREEELRFAIETVAKTADHWDDPLKQMFGGATYQEVLAGRTDESRPPVKPGEGVGMYL